MHSQSKFRSSFVPLLIIVGVWFSLAYVAAGEDNATRIDGYIKKYFHNMEEMKCRPGFIGLSPNIVAAAKKCTKQLEISSFLCFMTCTYRGFGYISPGRDDDLNFSKAETVTMESFNMETPEGQKSYQTIVINRYNCAYSYMGKKGKFALKFDKPEDCKGAEEFFSCSFKSLTCGSKDATTSTERK